MYFKLSLLLLLPIGILHAQDPLEGLIVFPDDYRTACRIGIKGTSILTESDTTGRFSIPAVATGTHTVQCYCQGYQPQSQSITIFGAEKQFMTFQLQYKELETVTAIGTSRETNRSESPIITDIYEKKYFDKNPGTSLIELMDRMNGVRPQVNCNVCGTGDIHINGLEGAYTLIVLDGIPMVGGLSSVYGLSGIPSFLIDKIEVTKGPASSLYGSEAVAGVIHAITRKASKKPEFHFQHFATSHGELNTDLGVNLLVGKKASVFTSGTLFWFNQVLDQNGDHFTDVPLQKRYSLYQKWKFDRPDNRLFTVSARLLNEDRWGGETNWNHEMRGSDSLYAETIITRRFEGNVAYQLPMREKVLFVGHFNQHVQDSYYGNKYFLAKQLLGFFQLTWDKTVNRHQFLSGFNWRQTYYNDNTAVTAQDNDVNADKPWVTALPGIFVQDQFRRNDRQNILFSARLDHHPVHGFIFTPRIALLQKFKKDMTFRIHAGTGFRVVNLFSEDHAALTGARQVVLGEHLNPERSYSINSSLSRRFAWNDAWTMETDLQVFYTYFSNRIVANYDLDPNKIYYNNLHGFAQSAGAGADLKLSYRKELSIQAGFTGMNVSLTEGGIRKQQILTEKWSGNWTITYAFKKWPFSIDYTGNVTGPMRLPVLGALDPRPAYSPVYSIQNIQVTYTLKKNIVFFAGVKNLLNWTPAKNIPFLIAGANDPFDKNVVYNPDGQIVATPSNPNALSFDPAYVYAPNQGIRAFAGVRLQLTR
jgi:outer membrane receptor for ferrienterochelin and colicins